MTNNIGNGARRQQRPCYEQCEVVSYVRSMMLSARTDMHIRSGPQGGAAEAVAAQLEARLRAALKSRANPFTEAAPGLATQLGRPLLALFDRSFELRRGPLPLLPLSRQGCLAVQMLAQSHIADQLRGPAGEH